MAISSPDYLREVYGVHRALGERALASDYVMVPIGFEGITLLIKGFPYPYLSAGEAVEVPLPLGISAGQPSQVKIFKQGQVQFVETVRGHIKSFNNTVLTQNRARFDAKIYTGSPDAYFEVITIRDCFVELESSEVDTENRTQLLGVNGTMSYHYLGEVQAGPLAITAQ